MANINQDYNGQTRLKNWWATIKQNLHLMNDQTEKHISGEADRHTAEDIEYSSTRNVKEAIEQVQSDTNAAINTKADKQNADGGFAGGGNGTGAKEGGAIGKGAHTDRGGAIGYGATTSDGFAGGYNARAYNDTQPIDAIQLGTGTNSTEKTLQVYDYPLLDANGKIPSARFPAGIGGGPTNAVYVYCDGEDDHLKLQNAIDAVEDTSIPTVIYPVGECVLKVAARGLGSPSTESVFLVDLGDNKTLDGRYCQIILDLTDPYEASDDYQFVTVFKAGTNSGVVNSNISGRGENVCNHILFSSGDTYTTTTTGAIFTNNYVHDIVTKTPSSVYVRGYIYTFDGYVYNNKFKSIDMKSYMFSVFINTGGNVAGNNFEDLKCGNSLIWSNGKKIINNTFKNIVAPYNYLIQVSGMQGAIVSGNTFHVVTAMTDYDLIGVESGYGNIMNNTFTQITAAYANDNIIVIGVHSTNTVVSGNNIRFATTEPTKSCEKTPIMADGAKCIVTNNSTSHANMGEISGTGSIVDNNVYVGTTTA